MKRFAVLLCLFCFSFIFIPQSFAQNEQPEVRFSVGYDYPEEFYQGETLTVQFTLEYRGEANFTGRVLLESKTQEGLKYKDKEFLINDLAPYEVYNNATSYSAAFAGGIYTKFQIDLYTGETVDFFEGENFIKNGSRVTRDISIYVKSYDTYLTEKNLETNQIRVIVAVIVGIISVFGVVFAYLNFRKNKPTGLEDNNEEASEKEVEKKGDDKPKAPMNENIELSKVRILESHLQGDISAMHSLVLGSYISLTALFATITLQTMNLTVMIIGIPLTAFGLLFILLIRVKKYQKRNLTYIDELLKKIENGEQLPSIIELEQEVSKRPL